ncbi:hypothetical protein QCD70_12730 [Agreia sp. PsM10]|uniref:hypothetical protein n=1 Tax=Agreia sp. PsM10 TaxID=3030533 RepID=UPI00263A6256|nr:hypothetical protein [Agreia sp. PsM10]MDN4641116.1 hypothetical protein [Agreia sp. PsM10]
MGLSSNELIELHPDVVWQRKFLDICDLFEILSDCIIANDYSIPDELNGAIGLTEAGANLKGRLIRKDSVPGKEAHLMCALTIGHTELFVDVEGTDVQKLQEVIGRELLALRIRFPLRYGREFYDAYAALFDEEKDVLTLDETFRLLDAAPVGVFQYGRYVIGPYGLQTGGSSRLIAFTKRVPAFHCGQPICRAVHPVRLTTGYDAPINEHRDKLRKMLEAEDTSPSEWWDFADQLRGVSESVYSDRRSGTLIAVIGDCLSDEELSHLVIELLDHDGGKLRQALRPFLIVNKASDAIAGADRAKLLQLVLLSEEELISAAVDRMIHRGSIKIERGEVRRSVVNHQVRSGAFRLAAEFGALGVRFVSDDPGLASLRERRLLSQLYVRDQTTDVEELDWQLRGFEANDLDERLEDFFQSIDPRTALSRMILARKTNMVTACHEVGLENGDDLSDADLVETVLWKLGFDVHYEEDPHSYFWDLQQRISALTQASRISGIGESETFRGVANTYFTQLEGLLIDSLAFGAWVFLNDHTTSKHPFSYDGEYDRMAGLSLLQGAFLVTENEHDKFDFTSERIELNALFRGFSVLADELARLDSGHDGRGRQAREIPDYQGKTELKKFLFRSEVPFLNLSRGSRARIIEGLRRISSTAISAGVPQVRNDYSHYRRTSPEVDRMAKALEAVAIAVQEIENLGIARVLSWPVSTSSDAWGRSRHSFSGPRSLEHLFARPSNYDWMGLPSLSEPQYLVRSASFAEPNEVLRFTRRFDSEFSRMWHDYPKPRKGPKDLFARPVESPSHRDELEIK